jgi:hypothetical protein
MGEQKMHLTDRLSRLVRFFVVLAAAFTAASAAGAVVVGPGGGSPLFGTTSAANPNLAGTIINDNSIPWTITNGMGVVLVSGNLQNRVTQSTALGTLIFSPRLTDIVYGPMGAPDGLSLTLAGYGAGTLDIDYRTDGLGEATFPLVARSASGESLFFPGVGPSPGFASSLFLSILSTATDFGLAGLFTITATFGVDPPVNFSTTVGGLAVPGMGGGGVIPLPAAAPLFLGALAIGGLARRRRREA